MVEINIKDGMRKRRFKIVFVLICVVAGCGAGFYFLIDYMAAESLRQRLASDDPDVLAAALVDAYNRWDGDIIDRILKELSSPSDTVRNVADKILRHHLKKHKDTNLLEQLRRIWEDAQNDIDLRERALHIIAAVAGKEWEDFFFSAKIWELEDPTSMWWDAASRYFERLADQKTYNRLLMWARSKDPQKCYTAVFLSRFLFKCFTDEQVEKLVDALAPLLVHRNLFIRATAAATLYKHLKKKHTKYILQALNDRTVSTEAATVREHLIETVRLLRLREAADRLYSIILNDVDDRIVQRAAAALAATGSDHYFKLAVGLLEEGANLPRVNLAGVMAFVGRMGGERAVRALVKSLMQPDPRLAKEAGTWLTICEPAAEDALIAALEAPTAQGRLEALSLLAKWAVKKSIPKLLKTALKEQPHVAEMMIMHLQYFPNTDVVPYLIKALEGKRGRVKAAIIDVLAFYRTPEAVAAVADGLLDRSQDVINTAQAKISDILRSLRNPPQNLNSIISRVMREYIAQLNCPTVKAFLTRALPKAKDIATTREIIIDALRQLRLQTSLIGTLSFRDDFNNINYILGNMLCDWWTLQLAKKLKEKGLSDLMEASYKAEKALQEFDPTGVERERNKKVVEQIKAALGLVK